MPAPALTGTYPLPGMPDATVTAGWPFAGQKLAEIFRNGPRPLVADIETYGVGADAGPGRIKCVTLSTEREAVVLNPREEGDHAEAARALAYASVVVEHKANFDSPSLAINRLITPQGVDKVVDTLVLARMADPGETVPKTLDALVQRYLKITPGKIEHLFKSLGFKNKSEGFLRLDIDSPAYLMGAASDGIATYRIWPHVYAAALARFADHPFGAGIGLSPDEAAFEIEKHQVVNRNRIKQTIRGLKVDVEFLDRYRSETGRERAAGEATLREAGITPGNGNHLTAWLEEAGALPPDHRRTDTGKLGAAAKDLETINHPLAAVFRAVKDSEKLDGYLQKCVDMMDEHGRIHPVTDVLKAAHGRDSMADPPLHQFPGPARGIILADTSFTSVDWSQQEPRIAMNLAGDVGPLFDYEQFGTKVYKGIGEYADVSDKQAKIVVLAGLYGQGLALLSSQLGLPPDPWVPEWTTSWGKVIEAHWGYQGAKDTQQAVFSAIPETYKFMTRGKQIARDHKLAYTVGGRILPVPSGMFRGKFSVQAHKWINFVVSGSAADELHTAEYNAIAAGLGDAWLWGMHDEAIVESSAAHDIRRIMETPSERFCRLAGRKPVIRTDFDVLGERWRTA